MKKNLQRLIEIPSGAQVEIKGNGITVKGSGKEFKRTFDLGKVKMTHADGKIRLHADKATKRESRMIGTVNAHVKNMIKGLNEEYVYKLEIASVHFPMVVKVDEAKKVVVIKTFLGEKADRHSKILPGAKVEVKGNEITVRSHDKEIAGQTAANIEKATKVKGRDRRIFQDGIFLTDRCGDKI